MKVDLIKDKQVKGMFLLAVTEGTDILAKTDIEFNVNGKEVSFENLINAINKNLNGILDEKVNQLVNKKIDNFMDKVCKIREEI